MTARAGTRTPCWSIASTPYVWKRGKGCVRPGGHDQAYCGWPMVRIGNSCVCGPGFISRHGDCYRPPVVVVVPGGPGYIPDGPGYVPIGPEPDYPDGPPRVLDLAPWTRSRPWRIRPTTILRRRPRPRPRRSSPGPSSPCAGRSGVDRPLPAGDLYDLLEETYGKRPSLDRCPAACLPKPASFTAAELDAAAEQERHQLVRQLRAGRRLHAARLGLAA